jgi:hypothetical protein
MVTVANTPAPELAKRNDTSTTRNIEPVSLNGAAGPINDPSVGRLQSCHGGTERAAPAKLHPRIQLCVDSRSIRADRISNIHVGIWMQYQARPAYDELEIRRKRCCEGQEDVESWEVIKGEHWACIYISQAVVPALIYIGDGHESRGGG